MKSKRNTALAVFGTLAVVAFSILLPFLAFRVQDAGLYGGPHKRQAITAKISPILKGNAMVRLLHDIFSETPVASVSSTEVTSAQRGMIAAVLQEMAAVGLPVPGEQERDIVRQFNAGDPNAARMPLTERYQFYSAGWLSSASLIVETRTGRAVSYRARCNYKEAARLSERKIVLGYISYLGLEEIQDWSFEWVGSSYLCSSGQARLKIVYSYEAAPDGSAEIKISVAAEGSSELQAEREKAH